MGSKKRWDTNNIRSICPSSDIQSKGVPIAVQCIGNVRLEASEVTCVGAAITLV
jgi:DUF971 family protein